jgi:Reverse transcriptase (RNA-dependent DNA polymerase)
VEGLRLPAWVLLYVTRWLAAPVIIPDGGARARDQGTPQGSAVSPVLANLFLHWAFDAQLGREFPGCPFERYADDGLIHCTSENRARQVLAALEQRMTDAGLDLHPGKTRIVYCKDSRRRQPWNGPVSSGFLGYAFRPRRAPQAPSRPCRYADCHTGSRTHPYGQRTAHHKTPPSPPATTRRQPAGRRLEEPGLPRTRGSRLLRSHLQQPQEPGVLRPQPRQLSLNRHRDLSHDDTLSATDHAPGIPGRSEWPHGVALGIR